MERINIQETLSGVYQITKETLKIEKETDNVSISNAIGEVNSKLFGANLNIKVEIESDDKLEDKTESIIKDENACEEGGNYLKIESGNYDQDQASFPYLDLINAYKSETVIKEESFSEYDLNNEDVFTRNNNPRELYTRKGKSFEKASYLKTHEKIHTGEKPYTCGLCGKAFTEQSNLRKHENIHTGIKPYSCNVCGKAFALAFSLKEHSKSHTCGMSFAQANYLKTHEKIHIGEKPYTCGLCGKAFTRQSNLKGHERIHTGEKPYTCGICGKSFTEQSNLRKHENIHTGIKPYSCNVCDKSFALAFSLKEHSKRIHTGEKPYTCNVCGKTFTQLCTLKAHEQIHTGVKPYSCGVCGKAFVYKQVLKRHEIIHTGEKPFSCEMCGKTFNMKSNLKQHCKKYHDKESFIPAEELSQNKANIPAFTMASSEVSGIPNPAVLDKISTKDASYHHLKRKKKTELEKYISYPKAPEEMTFIEIQIPETIIKDEFPDDKMDDDDVTFKSEVGVKKNSLC